MKEEKFPLLIIDGNNLILTEPYFLPDPDSSTFLADCRHWLQSRLQAMAAVKINIIAVYDGEIERVFEWGKLTTIYTLEADGVIIDIIREAKYLTSAVVTSDRALKEAVKDYGALTIQSEDFSRFLLERFPSWFQTDDLWSAVIKPLALRGMKDLEGGPKMAWEKVTNVVVLFGGDEVRFVTAYADRIVWNLLANPDNPETAFLIIEDRREIALQTYRDHSATATLEKIRETERVAKELQAIQGDQQVVKLAAEKAVQVKELRAQLPVNLFPYGKEAEAKMTYTFASAERGNYPKLILEDTRDEGKPSDLWIVQVDPPSEDERYPSIAVGIGGWISPRWIGKKNGGDTKWKYLVLGDIEVVQTDAQDEKGFPCVRVSYIGIGDDDRVVEELFYSVGEHPDFPAVGVALAKATEKANSQPTKPAKRKKPVEEVLEEVGVEANKAEPS